MKYKHNRKLTDCICDNCNITFQKPLSEYKRNLSLNRRNYCSRFCAGKSNKSNLPIKPSYDILKHCNNHIDEYTPFRGYLKKARQRFKHFDLTLKDLKQQWENQNGLCPYSGVKLELITHKNKAIKAINSASLDRIDSNIGYVKNNIQFVSIPLNYLKNNLTHNETIEICLQITKHFNSL